MDFLYDDEDVDYGYDNAGQVTSADRTGSGTDEEYVYDTNGNRLEVTRDGSTANWGVGDNNQLISDGTNSYTYDDEGNLISDGISTYYWDHRNRLFEVRTGSTGVMYTYDINNLRVGRIFDLDGDWDYSDTTELDTQTSYYFDGGRMVREVSADGTVENNYLFGANGQLIAVEDVANDVVEFAYNDHLGTVRDVIAVDASAAVHSEHNAYDSFGRVVERQQFDGTSWNVVGSESIVSLGYTGEYFDVTIGLQYNHNRWYNADTGRWISEDPIGFAGEDVNLGRYVGNKSVIYVDASGLQEENPASELNIEWKADDKGFYTDWQNKLKRAIDGKIGLGQDSFAAKHVFIPRGMKEATLLQGLQLWIKRDVTTFIIYAGPDGKAMIGSDTIGVNKVYGDVYDIAANMNITITRDQERPLINRFTSVFSDNRMRLPKQDDKNPMKKVLLFAYLETQEFSFRSFSGGIFTDPAQRTDLNEIDKDNPIFTGLTAGPRMSTSYKYLYYDDPCEVGEKYKKEFESIFTHFDIKLKSNAYHEYFEYKSSLSSTTYTQQKILEK